MRLRSFRDRVEAAKAAAAETADLWRFTLERVRGKTDFYDGLERVSADKSDDLQQAARKVLTSYWQGRADEWHQPRWESCIEEGLIDDRTVNAWAKAVWHRREKNI
jgi:hypothetical protein